jgi:hypothetical protein
LIFPRSGSPQFAGQSKAAKIAGLEPGTVRDTEAAMESKALAVVVTIAFSLVGVVGDYFLKVASAQEHSLRSSEFYVGFAVYASTAFGWLFVMKHLKLATISVRMYQLIRQKGRERDEVQ